MESFCLLVLKVGMKLRFLFKSLKVSLVNVLLLKLTTDPRGSDLNLAVLWIFTFVRFLNFA